jgi:hypothetical protein
MGRRNVKEHLLRNERYYLWGVIILFFVLRLACVAAFGNFDKSTFMDAAGYNEYAKTVITDSSWLTRTDFKGSFREPTYPRFVATVYYIFGAESFMAVYVIQAIISSLMLILIYKLAMILFQKRSVAYLSLIWAGCYIFYLRWVGELLRETMTYFLLVWLTYLFAVLFKNKGWNWKKVMLPSIVYTILIHTDGRYLFYAPFLFIYFVLCCPNLLSAIQKYFVFGLLVLTLTTPWTVRNYMAYGDVIIVSPLTLNLTGQEMSARKELFDTGRVEEAGSSLHYLNYNENYPLEAERDSILRGENPRNRSTKELQAIRKGKRAPATFMGRKWYSFKKMWFPINTGGGYAPFPMAYFEEGYSTGHNLISLLQYGALLPFFLISAIACIVRKLKSAWILLLPILVHMLLHLLTFGIERYRHPVDAFGAILSFYGAALLWQFLSQRKQKQLSVMHGS